MSKKISICKTKVSLLNELFSQCKKWNRLNLDDVANRLRIYFLENGLFGKFNILRFYLFIKSLKNWL